MSAKQSQNTQQDNQQNNTLVIKKYANRRLYNTATSQYITLQDLNEMVLEDIDFVVQDAKTQKDLTRDVLNQIIAQKESQQGDSPMMPINFLRRIISLYEDKTQTAVSSYLESSMNAFIENQEKVQECLKPLVGDMVPENVTNTMNSITKRNMQLFQNMFNPFGATQSKSETQTPEEELASIQKQLKYLQERIAVLQSD